MTRRAPALLAGATGLAWLALTTGYGAAAAGSGVDLGGEPLPEAASTSPESPTPLAPGLWQATLRPSFPQYFAYERRISGSRVHVGVLGAPRGEEGDGIEVEASVAAEGSGSPATCANETDSADISIPHAVIGAGVVAGSADGDSDDVCRSAGTVQIRVSRGSGSASTDLPYVIKVVEEAPSAGTDAEPDGEPAYDLPAPREPGELRGAASFARAPAIEAGDEPVTVRTTITEGTEQLWRVPLDWGDLMVARADVPFAEDEAFEYGGPSLTLHLVDPVRDRLGYADPASDDSDTGTYRTEGDDSEPTVLVASGFPVRQQDDRLPGDHWVSLAVAPPPADRAQEPAEIPVEVTVGVTRAAGADAGRPTYDGVVVSQDKVASLDGYSPQRPFLVGDGTFSAVASGGAAAAADGWFTTRRWAGVGVAAASIACLAAGLVRVRAGR